MYDQENHTSEMMWIMRHAGFAFDVSDPRTRVDTARALSDAMRLPLFVICPRETEETWRLAQSARERVVTFSDLDERGWVSRSEGMHGTTEDERGNLIFGTDCVKFVTHENLLKVLREGVIIVIDNPPVSHYEDENDLKCECIVESLLELNRWARIDRSSRAESYAVVYPEALTHSVQSVTAHMRLARILCAPELYKTDDCGRLEFTGLREVIDYAAALDPIETRRTLELWTCDISRTIYPARVCADIWFRVIRAHLVACQF